MPIPLNPELQELLLEEIRAFSEAARDEQTRTDLQALASAVQTGDLPDDALDAVGTILEVGLQTGRVRKMHRASGEQALLRLFAKTPAGIAQAQTLADLNKALVELEGQTIESVRVLARTPGVYLLSIGTDDCEMTLRFGPDGAGVEAVALGV
jgi:hypothetical protein